MKPSGEDLFWQLAAELQKQDPRVKEGTIMNARCLRVGKEFLGLVDYKRSGLVVKLPKKRVAELVESGVGRPFGPAGRIFGEWVSVPIPDRRRWRELLHEGIEFVAPQAARAEGLLPRGRAGMREAPGPVARKLSTRPK